MKERRYNALFSFSFFTCSYSCDLKKAEWKKKGCSVVKLGEPTWDFSYDSLITDQ